MLNHAIIKNHIHRMLCAPVALWTREAWEIYHQIINKPNFNTLNFNNQ